MAETLLVASGAAAATAAGATEYWRLLTSKIGKQVTVETDPQKTFRTAGVLKNLYIRVTANSTSVASTFRTRKNVANGNQSVTIPIATTGVFEDTTNTDTIAAGDELNYQSISGGTGTFSSTIQSCLFAATTDTATIMGIDSTTINTASVTRFLTLMGSTSAGSTTESSFKCEQQKAGTIKNLFVNVFSNARTNNTVFKIRDNAADSGVLVTVGNVQTGIFEDTSNSATITTGDDVNFAWTTITGTQALAYRQISCEYISTGGFGQCGCGVTAGKTINFNTTSNIPVAGHLESLTTENDAKTKTRAAFTFSNLTVNVNANTIATTASTLRFRKNGANGNQLISIPAGTTGLLTDSTNTDICSATDEVNYQLITPNTSGTLDLRHMGTWTLLGGNAITKTLATETISISEAASTRLAAKIRTRTDTAITVGETRARLSAKNRPIATQTVALSENVIRIKGKIKSLATETITVAGGTIARLLAKIRIASDTTAIAENRARLAAKNRALATQTTILSDSVTRIKGKLKSLATETITLGAGTAARLSAKIRALSTQTVALSDNRTRLKGSLRPLATQSITVSGGTLARLKASLRTISQTTVLSDSSNRLAAKLRALSTQTVVLSDARNRITTKLRTLSTQTVALADSVARLVEAPTGITRALSETVGLTDSVARLRASRVFLSETVPIAGVVARIRGIARLLPQTVPVAEQAARIKSSLRLILETIPTSENLARLNALRRTVIQTTVIAENVVGETVGNLVRSMVETITVSDSIARRTAKLVILDQFVIIAEQSSRLSTKLRAIPAQTISLSDSATNELNVIIKNVIKTIAQATTITDYAKIEVVKKSQRFRKILQPSIKRLISNHPAWFLGTRGQHDHYEEFAP